MKKIAYISFLAALLLGACARETPLEPTAPAAGVVLTLFPEGVERAATRAGDADNLDTEINIVDLSFFLIPAGSTTVAYAYVHQPFATADNTIQNPKRVVLPLTPGTLPPMDIHVIANCANTAALNAVQTLDDLRALQTPAATAAAGLTTKAGLPMYGTLSAADLNTSIPGAALQIPLVRACAKLRVTLTFTDPTWVGTANSFVLENAPPYTCYLPGQTPTGLTPIDYPSAAFTPLSTTQFQRIVYVYEAATPPQLHLYTTVKSVAKNYVAANQFPLPVRNYLYDIELQVLKPPPTRAVEISGEEMTVRVTASPWQ